MDYNWNDETYYEHELEEIFAEQINDIYGTVEIFGIEYDYATVAEQVDSISYREQFLNWMDSEGVEEI